MSTSTELFGNAYALEMNDESRVLIDQYLAIGRRAQTIGGVAGAVTGIAIAGMIGLGWWPESAGIAQWFIVAAGLILLPTVFAELNARRRGLRGPRIAALAPRSTAELIPHRLFSVLLIEITISWLAAVAVGLGWHDGALWRMAALATMPLAYLSLYLLAARDLAHRPQQATDAAVLAADVAIRRHGAYAFALVTHTAVVATTVFLLPDLPILVTVPSALFAAIPLVVRGPLHGPWGAAARLIGVRDDIGVVG